MSAIAVLNFDIILRDSFGGNLFNALINAKAIAFMHDIVANLQVIKTADLLSLIELFALLLLLLHAENIRL